MESVQTEKGRENFQHITKRHDETLVSKLTLQLGGHIPNGNNSQKGGDIEHQTEKKFSSGEERGIGNSQETFACSFNFYKNLITQYLCKQK